MGNSPSSSSSSSCFFFGFAPSTEKEDAFVSVKAAVVDNDDGRQTEEDRRAGVKGRKEEKEDEELTVRRTSSQSPKKKNGAAGGGGGGRELMRLSSFDKIHQAFQDLINPPPSESAAPPEPVAPISPPKPKRMLWGCETVEEHYQYIKEVCDKIKDKRGEEGLALLGLEFRMVHSPQNCQCRCEEGGNGVLLSSSASSSDVEGSLDNDSSSFNDFDNDDDYGYHCHEPESYMVPIGGGVEQAQPQREVEEEGGEHATTAANDEESFLAPIGTPLNDHPLLSKSALDLLALRLEMMESSDVKTKRISRVMSSASMFSLATHNTYTSSEGEGSSSYGAPGDEDRYRRGGAAAVLDKNGVNENNVDIDDVCTMRLFHNPTGELITERTHSEYIARGKMYDEVARLCMDVAQDAMIEAGDLEWMTLVGSSSGSSSSSGNNDEDVIPIRALASRNRSGSDDGDDRHNNTNTLLIVTGKGEVRAGIFSRRHLITSGIEVSTALPFIREAMRRRNMSIVILDPNARGWKKGMKTFQLSLEKLFLSDDETPAPRHYDESSVYVLAHSMAGSQLVRFLLDTTTNSPSTKDAVSEDIAMNGNNNSNNNDKNKSAGAEEVGAGVSFLQRIKAIAFTDANHNIGWVKTNLPVLNLIEGSRSLYLKSHKVHEDAKALGEIHRNNCDFWKRRFGKIRTIWAGTNEHALTNYAARWYIWDHFDQHLDTTVDAVSGVRDNDKEEEGDFAAAAAAAAATGITKGDNNDDDEGAPSF